MREDQKFEGFHDLLIERLSIIIFSYRNRKNVAELEMGTLYRNLDSNGDVATEDDDSIGAEIFRFKDPEKEEHVNGKSRRITIGLAKKEIKTQLNRQLCWMLSEAYEEFSEFVKCCYAYAAYLDKDLWDLEQFEKNKYSKVGSLQYEWFKERVDRNNKLTTEEILKRLKKSVPGLDKTERFKMFSFDSRVILLTISYFRNITVHKGGRVNRSEAINRITEKSGLNGDSADSYKEFLKNFLFSDELVMLDHEISNIGGVRHFKPFLQEMIDFLAGYSLVITRKMTEWEISLREN